MLSFSWTEQEIIEDETGERAAFNYENTLQFDCVTSETHEGSSSLTEHAVERGSALTDHKRNEPARLSIEAIVTNTPIDSPPPSGLPTSPVRGEVQQHPEARANVLVFDAPFDRMVDVFDALDRLRTEAVSLTVQTRIRTYENVQIASVSAPRTSEDGDSLRFSIELQQIRIAETRTAAAPEAPREPRGRARRDRGSQEAESAENRRESALSQTRDRYNERRANGESVIDSAMGAVGDVLGFGG